jgi:hypothetical protein
MGLAYIRSALLAKDPKRVEVHSPLAAEELTPRLSFFSFDLLWCAAVLKRWRLRLALPSLPPSAWCRW